MKQTNEQAINNTKQTATVLLYFAIFYIPLGFVGWVISAPMIIPLGISILAGLFGCALQEKLK